MQIGMMADIYWPHVSGITNYISLNKRFLEAAGHEVYVFTFGGEDYQDQEKNVIRSTGIPLGNTGYFFSLQYNRRARTLLQAMDIVHVHHPFTSGTLALRYCRPWGIPIVFTNHTRYDLYAHAYLPGVAEVITLAGIRAYLPSFCRSVDQVISPSPGMKDVLLELGLDVPIEVVPNGVDLQPFRSAAPMERSQLGFGSQDLVAIYVGRLGPEKNLQFLIQAFSNLSRRLVCARLLLVGDGPLRADLEALVEAEGLTGKVHFTGMVPYSEMPRYMAASDAFVTASVTEVHPLTVIEAMGSGLPVVGIRSPGVGDMVVDGETGFLIPEPDLKIFEQRLFDLLSQETERQRMGQQARENAEGYAIERTVSLMLDLYARTIERSRARKEATRLTLMNFWGGPEE